MGKETVVIGWNLAGKGGGCDELEEIDGAIPLNSKRNVCNPTSQNPQSDRRPKGGLQGNREGKLQAPLGRRKSAERRGKTGRSSQVAADDQTVKGENQTRPKNR